VFYFSGQDLNDDEDMSEQSDQLSVEGMAIPEGGIKFQYNCLMHASSTSHLIP
jgi:hypothetical protein